MTAVVVGASAGLGRALAEQLAAAGRPLLLVASDARDLAASAADLKLRHDVAVGTLALDLSCEPDPGERVRMALRGMPEPEVLLLVAGVSRGSDDFSLSPKALDALLAVNLSAPMKILDALLPALREERGSVVLCGSVAAARGRSRNVAYAACKRALVSVYESLRHSSPELCVRLYQLGFLDTQLTFGQRLPLPPADVERVARRIIGDLGGASGMRYLPRGWRMLAWLVKRLPWVLFRRMRV